VHKPENRSNISDTSKGLAAVALAAALWAAAAAVASSLFERGVEPFELVLARAVVATLGFAVLPAAWSRADALPDAHQGGRSRWRVIALGVALALVNLAYYIAIDRLAVAVAIVLQYSAPALVVIWTTVVSGRKPSLRIVICLTGAIAGVILVSEVLAGDLGRLDALGIVMGLASAVLFASYTLLSEPAGAAYGPLNAVFRAFAVASVIWIAVQIPRGWPATLFESNNILPVAFVGLAGTLVPFSLYVWGVRRVRAERASIAATLEPVLAALFAYVWLEESLSPMQLLGGVLVIAAVGTLQIEREAPLAAEP
jgi:drug/metabolite transporter, DME family